MKRRLLHVILSGVALALIGYASFRYYLRWQDDVIAERMNAPPVADNRPDPLFTKVPVPPELLSALESSTRFRITYRVSDIPKSVKDAGTQAVQHWIGDDEFSLAAPGTWPWNATDVIMPKLPRRRLEAVARNESLCLVFYEHGGFAMSNDVAVFRLAGEEAEAIWHANVEPGVINPIALVNAIHRGLSGNVFY